MTDEVKAYFNKRYQGSDLRVVPGHWPDFKSKDAVDKWMNMLNQMAGYVDALADLRTCPRCQFSQIEPDHNFCMICGLKLKEFPGK